MEKEEDDKLLLVCTVYMDEWIHQTDGQTTDR